MPFTENVPGEPCPYYFNIGTTFRAPSRLNFFAHQRFHRLEQRLGFQYHAFAAAERAVIDCAMPVVREGAQVMHAHVHEARLARPAHDPVIQRTGKKFGENCNDLKLHNGNSVSQPRSAAIQIAQAFREGHINALRFHVNVNAKLGGERD
jgi:hypothetical protein